MTFMSMPKKLFSLLPHFIVITALSSTFLVEYAEAQNRPGRRPGRPGNGNGNGDGNGRPNRPDRPRPNNPDNNNNGNVLTEYSEIGRINWGWNRNWAQDRGYIGTPSFRLRDNRRFYNALEHARSERDEHDRLVRQISPLQTQLRNKITEQTNAQNRVNNLETEIANLTTQIQEKRTAIGEARENLPQLRRRLTNATNALNTAQETAGTAQDNLETARATVRQKRALVQQRRTELQGCTQGPDCQAKQQALVAAQAELRAAQQDATAAQTAKQQADRAVTTATQRKTRAQTAVTNAENLIANGQTELQQLRNSKTQKETQLATAQTTLENKTSQVQTLRNRISPIVTMIDTQVSNFNEAVTSARSIRRELIRNILSSNREGHRNGIRLGTTEGNSLAYSLGRGQGQADGQEDGNAEGTAAGQAREYAAGYAQGEIDGEASAQSQGQEDGTALGRTQGNTSAGTREGRALGVSQAEQSDASSVGQAQGSEDGLRRARIDGEREGNRLGQQEAISESEGADLENVDIDGDFAGIFGLGVPVYPGVAQPSLRDCDYFRRPMIRMACADGLSVGYYVEAEITYNANVGAYYNDAYRPAYNSAYTLANSQYYQTSYDLGEREGFDAKYNQRYPVIKEQFRREAFSQYDRNPERDSSAYTNAHESARASAYSSKYEEIRAAQFAIYTAQVYSDNIQAQTDIFKSQRKSEVITLYENNPVLKFERFEIKDGGKRSVGVLDGIYMPEEDVVLNLVITNYGGDSASGAKVKLASGEEFTLPEIPANSVATLKGVAKTTVRTLVGQTGSLSFGINKALYSNEKSVQGRHFANYATGDLTLNQRTTYATLYPIKVNSLLVDGVLLLGVESSLELQLENRSQSTYDGLELQLTANLGNEVLVNTFENVATLSSGAMTTKDEARVLVSEESDALETLSFDLNIYKNNVRVGVIESIGSKLVQIGYVSKEDAPVLLGNAVTAPSDLLDKLQDLGGIENVSVIDLALDQGTLMSEGELSGKHIVVTERRPSTQTLTSLQTIIVNNENIILSSDQSETLNDFLRIPSLAHSVSETTQFAEIANAIVTVPNFYTNGNRSGVVVLNGIAANRANEIGSLMNQSDEELLDIAFNAMSPEAFLQNAENESIPINQKDAIKTVLTRVLAQAMMMKRVEDKDRREARNLRRRLRRDENDLVAKIAARLLTAREEENRTELLSGILILQEIEVALDDIDQFKGIGRSNKSNIKDRFERALSRAQRSRRSITGISDRRFFARRSSLNKLAGNFQPYVERD